jgi:hypothetical protein
MQGSAYIFINFLQAARFGHIGWGFLMADGSYCFGSTDHLFRKSWLDLGAWLAYGHVKPGYDNDWWMETGTSEEMLAKMARSHHIYYHAVKEVGAANAQPERALAAAHSMKDAGWSLGGNNCVHQTYRILTDYGAVLPAPQQCLTNIIPRKWFDKVDAQQRQLRTFV